MWRGGEFWRVDCEEPLPNVFETHAQHRQFDRERSLNGLGGGRELLQHTAHQRYRDTQYRRKLACRCSPAPDRVSEQRRLSDEGAGFCHKVVVPTLRRNNNCTSHDDEATVRLIAFLEENLACS